MPAIVACVGLVDIAAAQSPAGPAPDAGFRRAVDAGVLTGRPAVVARRAPTPPKIDADLDDPVWQAATQITHFTQQRPLDDAPATERTEVYIAYDSTNLYFGVYAHYSDRELIRANRVDRDQTGNDDTVAFFLDPFLDQQRAYVFSVNGYGVQADAIMTGSGGQAGGFQGGGGGGAAGGRGGGGNRGGGPGGGGGGRGGGGGDAGQDPSWNALFESAGRLVEDGWVAELAIPFKSLRYPSRQRGEAHRWGFQVQRDIESKNESVVWAPVSRDVASFMAQMGVLEGLTDLSTSRNLELLPTVTAVNAGALDTATGRFTDAGTDPDAGMNVKYGITSNLTLDATFNPDFSQIESDRQQIEVNQRFPLFFAELRPFFLEGQELFQTQGPIAFVHTRTIVDPRYGAKLSGKAGRLAMGLVYADDEAPGKIDDPADPYHGRSAQFVLGRLRYDLYSESSIGLLVTDREFGDRHSRVALLDGQFRLGRTHEFGFKTAYSDHRDEEGVRRTAPFLDLALRKEGRHLSYGVFHHQIPPEFRTDAGFVRRVDLKRTNANVQYRWWPQTWVINWGPRAGYARNYDFAGVLQDEEAGIGVNAQLQRNIFFNTSVNRDMERFAGVPFRKTRVSIGGGANASRRIGFGAFFNAGDEIRFVADPFLGRGSSLTTFANIRPFSRLQSEINFTSSRLIDPRTDTEVFDVKLYRAQTVYQFTSRLLARNIVEYNNFAKTLGVNVLLTYRVNAGTVFYLGFDDRHREGTAIDRRLFLTPDYQRTNRAIFTKFQYLFRY